MVTPSVKVILLHLMGESVISAFQLCSAYLSVFLWYQLLLSIFVFFFKSTKGIMESV